MKLTESLKGLICEIASVDSVVNAVKNKQKVVIYYDGDEPGGRGLREIEPVCLGVSKAGNKVLRAWDDEGASHTAYKGEQPLPGWRLFRLDKILSLKPTGENFTQMRPNFNPNGDKSMVSIIAISNFGQNQQPQPQSTQPQSESKNYANEVFDKLKTKVRDVNGKKLVSTIDFKLAIDELYKLKEKEWIESQRNAGKNLRPGEGTRKRFTNLSNSELNDLLNKNNIIVSDETSTE